MKAKLLLAALLSMVLAGCTLRSKPAKAAVPPSAPKPVAKAAPAPPPPPLSIPQTHVELPKPQPVDPAALVTETAPPDPPPVAAAPPRIRRSPPPSQPVTPPAAALPPPEPARETVQEIVPAAEQKRLQDEARARRLEVSQILSQLGRQVTGSQRSKTAMIRNFLALSEEAEKHNDLRQADSFAERAQILAKELQSGK